MMSATANRLIRPVIGIPILTALLLLGSSGSTASQDATRLDITSVEHEPGEGLAVSVLTDEPAAQLQLQVDGEPQPFTIQESEAERPTTAVVLVIEASENMRSGAAPALAVAHSVVDALRPGDQVAVVSFSDAPAVLYGPGSDLEQAGAAIDALPVGGGSDLYGGVATAALLLDELSADSSSIAVLTYGWDWAGSSAIGRSASLDLVQSSGAPVYPLLLGTDFDFEYLAALARTSDGVIRSLDQAAAFPGLVVDQEGTSTAVTLQVEVPVLPLGSHTVEVVGAGSVASAEFEVTNEGLFATELISPHDPGDPITIRLDIPLSVGPLDLVARLGGQDLPIDDGAISIDPWLFEAGAQSVRLVAELNGAQLYAGEVDVMIPSLEPEIGLTLKEGDSGQALQVTWRVQGLNEAIATVLVDGEVVQSTAEREFQIDTPAPAQAEVRIETSGGALLSSELLEVPASGQGDAPSASDLDLGAILPYAGIAVLLFGLATIVAIAGRRLAGPRRRSSTDAAARHLRIVSDTPTQTAATAAAAVDLCVVATRLDGRALTTVEAPFPADAESFTIGTSPQCDLPLRGSDVAFLHAILDRTADGLLRIHFLGAVDSTSRAGASPEERLSKEMLRQLNEPFAIAGYTLRVTDTEANILAAQDEARRSVSEPPILQAKLNTA